MCVWLKLVYFLLLILIKIREFKANLHDTRYVLTRKSKHRRKFKINKNGDHNMHIPIIDGIDIFLIILNAIHYLCIFSVTKKEKTKHGMTNNIYLFFFNSTF